jgi:hypothetical protein
MRGERQLLRLGEYLVRRASRQLPRKVREERYTEWLAELPVILHDPNIRFAPRRAVRMVAYAADTFRGTALTHARSRRRRLQLGMAAALRLMLVASLALLTWQIWNIAREPGLPLSYLRLAWDLLLVAYPMSVLVRSAQRVTTLTVVSGTLLGVAVNLWDAAQAPGDWVNYCAAASLILLLLALWLVSRWARIRRARYSGTR